MNIKPSEDFEYTALWNYLGTPDSLTEKKARIIIEKLKEAVAFKEIHKEFAVAHRDDGIYLNGEIKLEGANIKKHLDGCDRCVLFAATLGIGVDALIRRLAVSDMASSVICDAAASVMIETLCDKTEKEIRECCERSGLFLTSRYSPGYGDFPIEANTIFQTKLDTVKRLGMSVTDEMLLLPRKSVTAVMGISEKETKGQLASCEGCKLYSKCEKRKAGKHCADR